MRCCDGHHPCVCSESSTGAAAHVTNSRPCVLDATLCYSAIIFPVAIASKCAVSFAMSVLAIFLRAGRDGGDIARVVLESLDLVLQHDSPALPVGHPNV
jgi:hypothetical protein